MWSFKAVQGLRCGPLSAQRAWKDAGGDADGEKADAKRAG